MAREHIHTVFDRMAAKGVFRENPANIDSINKMTGQSAYEGPVRFPRMLYHPEGKKMSGPGVDPATAPIIAKIVNTPKEEEELLKAGWHTHPSDAVQASFTPEQIAAGAKAPPKSSQVIINNLEDEIVKLKAQLAAAQGASLAPVADESERSDA